MNAPLWIIINVCNCNSNCYRCFCFFSRCTTSHNNIAICYYSHQKGSPPPGYFFLNFVCRCASVERQQSARISFSCVRCAPGSGLLSFLLVHRSLDDRYDMMTQVWQRNTGGAYYPIDYLEAGGSCRRHAERTEINWKCYWQVNRRCLPLCVPHTHNSFLSSHLSFASSLAFLFAKQTKDVGRKKERRIVQWTTERGALTTREQNIQTHLRARAPFRIVKRNPLPPFPPILL